MYVFVYTHTHSLSMYATRHPDVIIGYNRCGYRLLSWRMLNRWRDGQAGTEDPPFRGGQVSRAAARPREAHGTIWYAYFDLPFSSSIFIFFALLVVSNGVRFFKATALSLSLFSRPPSESVIHVATIFLLAPAMEVFYSTIE